MKYETPLLVVYIEYEDVIRTSAQEGDDSIHQDDF